MVLDGQGNLYGATMSGTDKNGRAGGPNPGGTLFEIARGSGTVTTLAAFGGTGGSLVGGVVLAGQGNIYGTSNPAGNNQGTVFRLLRDG